MFFYFNVFSIAPFVLLLPERKIPPPSLLFSLPERSPYPPPFRWLMAEEGSFNSFLLGEEGFFSSDDTPPPSTLGPLEKDVKFLFLFETGLHRFKISGV